MENIKTNINQSAKLELLPTKLAQRLLEITPNRAGNKILELGAREADAEGNHIGDDCVYLAKEGNAVTLIESSPGILEHAKENAVKFEVRDKINFVESGFEKIDIPNEEFDAAFSMSGLDGSILPESLAEVARLIKPGAKVLLFIYYKSGDKLIQGPEERLESYVGSAGLNIDSKFIKTIDSEKGLEAIIFELHK